MLTAGAAPADGTANGQRDCRSVARSGQPSRAWETLVEATGARGPVLGSHGHGLRPVTGTGDLVVAGTAWQLMRAAGPDTRPPAWTAGLSWLRLGLSEWLRDRAVAYLGGRVIGGQPLIEHQMVRGSLAEAATTHEAVAATLQALPSDRAPAFLVALHDELTVADRTTLRLLGASGFLDDGPGQVGYLSELLADAYLDAGGAGTERKQCDE